MATTNESGAKNTGHLLDSGAFSDVAFILKQKDGSERRITAHKSVLASTSPVFESMFFGDLKEKGDIRITDATAEGFAQFLDLFYKPKVNFIIDNIYEVMRLIDKYNVTACRTIESYLTTGVTIENVCVFYELAATYLLNDGLIKAFKPMICEHFESALKSPHFVKLGKEAMADILKWDELNCDERTVFEVAVTWATTTAAQRQIISSNIEEDIVSELGKISSNIRFHRMALEEFLDILNKYPSLLAFNDYIDIIRFICAHKENENSQVDLSRAARSPKSAKQKAIKFQEKQPSGLAEESEILLTTSLSTLSDVKLTIHKLELILSEEEVVQFDKITIKGTFKYICSNYGSGNWAEVQSVEIPYDKLYFNPLKKRCICQLDNPFIVIANRCGYFYSISWQFRLTVSHPTTLNKGFIDKENLTVESATHGQIQFTSLNCANNFGVANIELTID